MKWRKIQRYLQIDSPGLSTHCAWEATAVHIRKQHGTQLNCQHNCRNLLGEELSRLGIEDLQNLQNHLQVSLKSEEILLTDEIKELHRKGDLLYQENVELYKNINLIHQENTELQKKIHRQGCTNEAGRGTNTTHEVSNSNMNDLHAPIDLRLSQPHSQRNGPPADLITLG
ncbi:unnamed protein product [Coffea canephora]|uniref:K-box domain-containing protein n=1 Tax=Coffea canephora TaxID=49390 RepID=A0A068TN26_COFCA|nr:unnamed protein product [Coffea canephora]